MADYSVNTSSTSQVNQERLLLGKIFGYAFLGMLLTLAVCIGITFIFVGTGLIEMTYESGKLTSEITATGGGVYMGMLITSSILQLILTFWISFGIFKGGKSLIIPYILYSVCMGVFLSSFTLYLEWYVIAGAFGITCLAFGAMSIFGMLSKGKANVMGIIGFGLIIGCALVGMFSWFLIIFAPATSYTIYIVISAVMVVALLLITAFDVHNIKKTIEAGQMSKNLALYCAFNLYVDFIMIFLRILSIIASVRARN